MLLTRDAAHSLLALRFCKINFSQEIFFLVSVAMVIFVLFVVGVSVCLWLHLLAVLYLFVYYIILVCMCVSGCLDSAR